MSNKSVVAHQADIRAEHLRKYLQMTCMLPFVARAEEGFFICRDRPSLPFRCLDPQYRRELVRVYLTNVEGICRRFVDEKRESLVRMKETTASFKAYWACQTAADKKALVQHKGSDMLKVRQAFASTDNRLVYCTFHGLTGSYETGV